MWKNRASVLERSGYRDFVRTSNLYSVWNSLEVSVFTESFLELQFMLSEYPIDGVPNNFLEKLFAGPDVVERLSTILITINLNLYSQKDFWTTL